MHTIEPYYGWRDLYVASEDDCSPFYRRQYSEFEYINTIYNYYIHPQWDGFGSSTMYIKILFTDYDQGFTIIEFIGEWNDCINNDIMYLKHEIVDHLAGNGITKYILICENVLNFHGSDDCYYQEWKDNIVEEGGWIAAINLREHVIEEIRNVRVHNYINVGPQLNEINWRTLKPATLVNLVENLTIRELTH